MIDRREMRLNEMAVAMGAPINPRRKGGGPHTSGGDELLPSLRPLQNELTQKPIQKYVGRRDDEDDARRHCK